MNSRSGKSQQIHHRYTVIYLLTAALAVLLALAIGIVSFQLGDYQKAPGTTNAVENNNPANPDEPSEKPAEPSKKPSPTETKPISGVTYLDCSRELLAAQSPLHNVSPDNPFTGGTMGLTSIHENRTTVQNKKIQVSSISLKLAKPAFDALDALNKAYAEAFPQSDKEIMVTAAFALDLDELQKCRCSESGYTDITHSNHSTGYAFDIRFTVVSKGANYQVYDPMVSAEYRFLQENCAKFGLIQTYKNSAKNQVDYSHFQYVGIPHAQYITENSLNLKDYNETLKLTYNFNKPLQITANEKAYEIYFVKANPSGDSRVPVLKDSIHTVFGNGRDGFIVTIEK